MSSIVNLAMTSAFLTGCPLRSTLTENALGTGVDAWTRRGDAFSVYFGLFLPAVAGPVAWSRRPRRPPAVGRHRAADRGRDRRGAVRDDRDDKLRRPLEHRPVVRAGARSPAGVHQPGRVGAWRHRARGHRRRLHQPGALPAGLDQTLTIGAPRRPAKRPSS